MALKLSAIPTFNTDGRKWIEVNLADDESFKLLVGSTYSSEFRSGQAAIARQINAVSSNEMIGSKDFSIEKSSKTGLVDNDMYVELVARCLVFDWNGVVDDDNNPVPYDAETCVKILRSSSDIFMQVIRTGNEIASDKAEQVADTVEK